MSHVDRLTMHMGEWDVERQRTCCGRGKLTGGCEGRSAFGLTEDDDGDVDGAEDTELVCLLEETVLALWFVYAPGWVQGVDRPRAK